MICNSNSNWVESRLGFPGCASGKEFTSQCRRHRGLGSIPWSGRSPGGGYGKNSSILALEIPQTEEPAGLQFMGSPRVRHHWSDLTHTDTHRVDHPEIQRLLDNNNRMFHSSLSTDAGNLMWFFSSSSYWLQSWRKHIAGLNQGFDFVFGTNVHEKCWNMKVENDGSWFKIIQVTKWF